jgi:hypothetical protein
VVYLFGWVKSRVKNSKVAHEHAEHKEHIEFILVQASKSKTLRLVLDCIDVDDLGRLATTWPQGFGLVHLILADG